MISMFYICSMIFRLAGRSGVTHFQDDPADSDLLEGVLLRHGRYRGPDAQDILIYDIHHVVSLHPCDRYCIMSICPMMF